MQWGISNSKWFPVIGENAPNKYRDLNTCWNKQKGLMPFVVKPIRLQRYTLFVLSLYELCNCFQKLCNTFFCMALYFRCINHKSKSWKNHYWLLVWQLYSYPHVKLRWEKDKDIITIADGSIPIILIIMRSITTVTITIVMVARL